MLDLSPENALSLMPAKDFDAKGYAERDIELGIKIRNHEIKLEVARRQYNQLFGGE